ncbi:MAG: T9SS type A sorting domain-containing protein [Paludibacter sp.]|nr:T9SS type A sorting domain-containing protein [Paludibacter sp.]
MKRRVRILCNIFIFSLFTCAGLSAQTPAFPTAEGYGKYATGGRGGQVVFVENLDDYIAYNNLEAPIPGSFRWALTQYPGEPLTVIFRVSGTIKLKPYIVSTKNLNDIRCSRANLTIAGQSAPGQGICIRNSKVNLGGSTDLIIRDMRFRIGENAADSTFIPGGSVGCENATRVIFDHCVFGWSGEENLTMYDNRFTTVQWSIFHEALYDDGHGKGNRGYGGQLGGVNATLHHNLFAHNQSRSPRLNGARTETEIRVFIEYINNVNYNWGSTEAAYGGDVNTGTLRSHTANFVANYYKPGPATSSTRRFFTNYIVNGANLPKWYLTGNIMDGNPAMSADNWTGFATKWSGTAGTTLPTKEQLASDTLLFPPQSLVYNGEWIGYQKYKINMESAENAYQSVLSKAGTIYRDSIERRVIKEVKTGTAIYSASLGKPGIIDKSYNAEGYLDYPEAVPPVDNDRDGMDDAWETANGLNPADPSDRNLKTTEGYTALEVYLNSLMGEMINHDFNTNGTSEINARQISIYPSIVEDKISIVSDVPLTSASIFSLSGIKLYSIENSQINSIDATFLSQGCYLLTIGNENGVLKHFKFIKE